jgi:hypothetical protein
MGQEQGQNIQSNQLDVERRRRRKAIIMLGMIMVTAWAPWITEERAYDLVTDYLGEETPYNYLGEIMPVREVPKTFTKLPFIAIVTFPGEAMYIVTFWGWVI